MKRFLKGFTELVLILEISSILMAFERVDESEIIIVGDISSEFTIVQNDYPVHMDVSNKEYCLKNIKTREIKKYF